MDEHRCAGCGASLPPAGTYCLACDTPVAETSSRLSVGDMEVVAHGRPLLGVAVIVASLVALGAVGWTGVTLYHRHRAESVSKPALAGVRILLGSEAGRTGGCPYLRAWIAGDPKAEERACLALAHDDPGAHVRGLHATAVHRHGSHATVTLAGTLVDAAGRRPWSRSVPMVEQHDDWLLAWDGTPVTTGG
jgi:hypothetical protein